MHASRLLSELIAVREWLHETAPQPHSIDATTGYWKFTKHQLMQSLRMGKPLSLSGMDPDAVNREENGALAPDDAVSGLAYGRVNMLTRDTELREIPHPRAICAHSRRQTRRRH